MNIKMRLKDEEKVKIYTFLCYLFWIFNLLPKKLLPSLAAEFILIFWIFSGDWLKKKQALKENIQTQVRTQQIRTGENYPKYDGTGDISYGE